MAETQGKMAKQVGDMLNKPELVSRLDRLVGRPAVLSMTFLGDGHVRTVDGIFMGTELRWPDEASDERLVCMEGATYVDRETGKPVDPHHATWHLPDQAEVAE